MKTSSMTVLVVALLALAAARGRPADDPEPPPPVKVGGINGAGKIEAKTGKNGPVLHVERGPGRGTSSFEMTLAERPAPERVTLLFKGVTTVSNFALAGLGKGGRFNFNVPRLQGKQTVHVNATGKKLPDEKGARLTVHFDPKNDHVEVVLVRHKDKKWPEGPIRVSWRTNPPLKRPGKK
jgi:hypothetical protein